MGEVTIGALVATYNALAETLGKKPVKKFKDKPTAIARVKELQALAKGNARRAPYPWPFIGKNHPIRPATLRGQLANALMKGATVEELQALADKHYATLEREVPKGVVNSLLGILHNYNGFGIREDSGKLFLVEG